MISQHKHHSRTDKAAIFTPIHGSDRGIADALRHLGANSEFIQNFLREVCMCDASKKTVDNMFAKLNAAEKKCTDLLQIIQNPTTKCVKYISDVPDDNETDWAVFTDNGRNYQLRALAWSFHHDLKRGQRFGEVLIVDVTKGTNNQHLRLLNVCCLDGSGKTVVVAQAFTFNEKQTTFSWMFRCALPELLGLDTCARVHLICVDGDIWQRAVIESCCIAPHAFLNAKVRTCAWHLIVQKFAGLKRLVPTQYHETFAAYESIALALTELTRTDDYKEAADELFGGLAELCSNLTREGCAASADVETLAQSLQTNERYYGGVFFSTVPTLGVRTTSPIESYHGTLKTHGKATTRDGPAKAFWKISQLAQKRHNLAREAIAQATRSFAQPCPIMELAAVFDHVTTHAFSLLSHQWTYSDRYRFEFETRDEPGLSCTCVSIANPQRTFSFLISNCGAKRRATCSCGYSNNYLLPCRHLLGFKKSVELLDVHYRWLVRYVAGHIEVKQQEARYHGIVLSDDRLMQISPTPHGKAAVLNPSESITENEPVPENVYTASIQQNVYSDCSRLNDEILSHLGRTDAAEEVIRRHYSAALQELEKLPTKVATRNQRRVRAC
eukprot:c19398_g1_i1.p1 GENE.c19398_g1_i1~~c19398_g1_i1.p1  ORF type:complete len:611 (-),score=79.68 c19398_g1_i1:1867-3699(-)